MLNHGRRVQTPLQPAHSGMSGAVRATASFAGSSHSMMGSPWYWQRFGTNTTMRTMAEDYASKAPISHAYAGKGQQQSAAIVSPSYPAIAVQERSTHSDDLLHDVQELCSRLLLARMCGVASFDSKGGFRNPKDMAELCLLPAGHMLAWLKLAPEYIRTCGEFLERSGQHEMGSAFLGTADALTQFRNITIV